MRLSPWLARILFGRGRLCYENHDFSFYKRRQKKTYQLAIQATCVAVQLVIETTAPEWRMSSPTVGALCLYSAGSGVVISTKYSWINASGGGTRPRRTCVGGILGLDCEVRTAVRDISSSPCAGAKLGRGDGLGKGLLVGLRKGKRGGDGFGVTECGLRVGERRVLHCDIRICDKEGGLGLGDDGGRKMIIYEINAAEDFV